MKVSPALTANNMTYPICKRVFEIIVHGVGENESNDGDGHLAQEEYQQTQRVEL